MLMLKVFGRLFRLSSTTEPASGLVPSGFDPGRVRTTLFRVSNYLNASDTEDVYREIIAEMEANPKPMNWKPILDREAASDARPN
jgi:hypothetical protein